MHERERETSAETGKKKRDGDGTRYKGICYEERTARERETPYCIMREERKKERERGRRKYMHVRIVTAGIRKWGGGRGRSPQRDVRRRDRYAGVYGSRPLRFGPLFFLLLLRAFLARSPHGHRNVLTVPLPRRKKKTLFASRFGGRVSDCVITGSHTGAESPRRSVGRRDPPAFNERHFSSFPIQPV